MFDVDTLHPSHEPMRAAAAAANANVCLREAEGFVAELAERLRAAYGDHAPLDNELAANIGVIAQAMANVREWILQKEGL